MRKLIPVLFLALAPACSPEPPVMPTFSDIQKRIFNVSCTFSVCHNVSAHKGNLVLTEGRAYGELINVLADQEVARARGKIRVVPGNPEASFLFHKLDQSPALLPPNEEEGEAMPQVGIRLPQQKIDAIREWIQKGAPQD